MGKKRIIKKSGRGVDHNLRARSMSKLPKKKISKGTIYILATYNNTLISLADEQGNAILQSSAGALGFSGARKSTPYAAAKVAELIAEKGKLIGLQEAGIYVKGVGAGRESAVRAFAAQGIELSYIKDVTPLPHNGPRLPKPRRV